MKKLFILTLLLLVLTSTEGYCSYFDLDDWSLGAYVTRAPWQYDTKFKSFTIGSSGDSSPVPSEIYYLSSKANSTWSYGISARGKIPSYENAGRFVPLLGITTTALMIRHEGFINNVMGQVGMYYVKILTEHLRISTGTALNIAYFWGNIGKVGGSNGDYVLIAPDGNEYGVDSDIKITKTGIGLDLLLGIEWMFNAEISMLIESGYRVQPKISEWTYVVSDGNGDESELPSSAFTESPPELGLNGLIFQLKFLITLD